jgi:hypothetical protein
LCQSYSAPLSSSFDRKLCRVWISILY